MEFPPLQDVVRGGDFVNQVRPGPAQFGEQDFDRLLSWIPPAKNQGAGWEIWKTLWSDADERGYEAFVTAIGRSGCISIDDCLRSPANPYRDLDNDTVWLGDCMDMVYVLRGYYAWKNGLPFSFQDAIAIKGGPDAGRDSRYSKYGNRIISRADVIQPEGYSPRNAPVLLGRIFNIVSTAMLRTLPEDQGRRFSDFYPVKIERDALRPGSIAYDIYGHVSIVYDIDDQGRILLISSHPDYTVTRELYGHHVVRSEAALGGGLKAWRPIRLVGARQTSKGTFIGGRIVGAPNDSLPHFSMEQVIGTDPTDGGDWREARFEHDGRAMPYYDFVRARLRAPGTKLDPVEEMANATDAMCASLKSRVTAVDLAIFAGMHRRPSPERLPPNIYGTYGDWERYATPSRDARLKMQGTELRSLAERLIERHAAGDPVLAFNGGNLAAALLDVYDRSAEACKITYRRTDRVVVTMTLHHAMERLFDMSFDPFHCPERRWGASGKELSSCADGQAKDVWYRAQTWLRNEPHRTYHLKTDFTAEELKDPALASAAEGGVGRSTPPDVDVLGFLRAQAKGHPVVGPDPAATVLKAANAINGATDAN